MAATLVSRLLDLALPAACVGCGREGPPICPVCLPSVSVRAGSPPGTPVGLWGGPPAPLLQVEWCAPFSGVVRRALHALKYGGERRLAQPLGGAIADRWRQAGTGADVIVPVPVHATRRRARGYDQAVLLAEVAAARLGMPCRPVVVRARDTVAQYRLGRAERATNLAGAFTVPDAAAERVRGRWVLLVDDVLTTGATLGAVGSAVLAAGAVAVSAVTVARER